MRHIKIASVVAIGLLVGTAVACAAPTGSYTKTCTDIQATGSGLSEELSASCRTMSGAMKSTTLQWPSSCVGDIGNIDGNLACAGPNGSFAITCSNISVSGNTLSATCKRKDGSEMATSLPGFQGFQGQISNCNGQLQNGPC